MSVYKFGAGAVIAVAVIGICAGCASVNPDPAFNDVQRMVLARTGKDPRWVKDESANAAIDQTTRQLLNGELTVDTAVQVALLNNASLQATYEEIGISQADLAQAGRLKNPEVGISVRVPERRSLLNTRERRESLVHQSEQTPLGNLLYQGNGGPGQRIAGAARSSLLSTLDATGEVLNRKATTTTNLEFAVAEDFLDAILLPLRKKLAAQKVEQAKLFVGGEIVDLIGDVKKAFFAVQARQQLLDRLAVILDADTAAAELALKQYEAGTLNELNLIKQQTQFDRTRIEQAQAQAQLSRDREALNQLMGVSGLGVDWTITAPLPDIPDEAFPNDAIESLALSQRFDLAAINQQIAFATRSLSLTRKTRLLPTHVDVGFDTERDPDRLKVRGATVGLDVPVFDQGQAKVARLQAQVRQAQRTADALKTRIRTEVRDANIVLNANRIAAQAYRDELLPKQAKILQLTLQHYNYMLKGTYDLLLAREQQARAERECIESVRDYWIARSELERAAGGKLSASNTQGGPETPAAQPPAANHVNENSGDKSHEHHP